MERNAIERATTAARTALATGQAKDYLRASKSANTLKAYRSDWEHFTAWCRDQRIDPMPSSPETVAMYIADLAESCKPSTIARRLAAISVAHQAAGHDSPTRSIIVRDTLKGIRRTVGVAPDRKAAIRADHVREVAPKFSDGLQDLRDKAILLIGYAGAFRRSELTSLNREDIEFTKEGLRIVLRKSKMDQEGEGQVKGIGYGANAVTCPVRALQAWIEAADITTGPLFRPINRHGQMSPVRLSDKGISLIIKRIASKIGIDPEDVGGHSLRAGFVTDQYAKGTPEAAIMRQTGHKSRAILGIYHREAGTFAFNYTAAAGL